MTGVKSFSGWADPASFFTQPFVVRSASAPNMTDTEIKFFVTPRGKDILQYQNFLFRSSYNKVNSNVSKWYCIKQMTHDCKATIFLVDGNCIRFKGFHSHENELKRIICFEFKKKLNEELKPRDELILSNLYKEFMVEYQKNLEDGFEMPDYDSIKKILFNKKFLLQLKTPKSRTRKEAESNSVCLSNQSEDIEEISPKCQEKLLESQGTNPEELQQPKRFTVYKPYCSTVNDTSGVESVIITDLRTIAVPDLHSVLPSLQSIPFGHEDSLCNPESKTEAEDKTKMDEGIKEPTNLRDSDINPLDLTKQIQNSGSLPNIISQTESTIKTVNVMEEESPDANKPSVITSADPPITRGKTIPCKENVSLTNDRTLYASMAQPQQLLHSISANQSVPKYSPLSAIDNTCSTILNQFHQRLPPPIANMPNIFNNIQHNMSPYMYHPYQRMHSAPNRHPLHSIGPNNAPADRTFGMNSVSSSHIESGTTSTTCLNTVQSVTILNQSNNNPYLAKMNNCESSVANFPPNMAALPPVSYPTNNTQSNQGTFPYIADPSVPLSASSGSINQAHFSPNGLGQHHPCFPGIHQNGPIGAEAYHPGNRLPSYPVNEIGNPVNVESTGSNLRKNKRALNATESDNQQTSPIIVNAFAAKEISSPGMVRPKDRFDIYSEYLAEEMRTIDPRTCALIQKVVGDIIFDARTKVILSEK